MKELPYEGLRKFRLQLHILKNILFKISEISHINFDAVVLHRGSIL